MLPKPHNIINVLLADDHEIFRDGFRIMLKKQNKIVMIGEAENGNELIDLTTSLQPDIIITDIKMPKIDGIEATRILINKYPHIGIIALTMFDDDHLIIDMLEAGARGYLIKNATKLEIFEAIKTVHENGTYYCRHTSNKLTRLIAESKFDPFKKNEVRIAFSKRELEIIQLICEERSNKEIASQLILSVRTIEGHRENIEEKMNVRNTAGIVVYAIKHGIFQIK
jgi:DNA-binding NarL/FixJ family response regulator